jgi:hypothetical protein
MHFIIFPLLDMHGLFLFLQLQVVLTPVDFFKLEIQLYTEWGKVILFRSGIWIHLLTLNKDYTKL